LLALVGIGADADDEGFDPTPPAEAVSRPGDVYLLGEHRLICGDARDQATWDALVAALGSNLADAMWTDPPYGVDLQIGGEAAMDGDRPEQIAPLLRAVLAFADERLALGAPWYICAPTGGTFGDFQDEIERVGWHLAQTLIWVKNAFVPGRADYHHQHEALLYGWKRGAAHRWLAEPDQSTVLDDEPNVARMRREELVALVKQLRNARRTDVVREDKTRHNDLHPTMKPTALIRQLLANSTRRGDVVLDPFAGSGSTMVACELLGRRTALIELEPRFCDVIARRWSELSPGNRAELVRG
jgi:DNA modification methylase